MIAEAGPFAGSRVVGSRENILPEE